MKIRIDLPEYKFDFLNTESELSFSLHELARGLMILGNDVISGSGCKLDTPYDVRIVSRLDKKYDKQKEDPPNTAVVSIVDEISLPENMFDWSPYTTYSRNSRQALNILQSQGIIFSDEYQKKVWEIFLEPSTQPNSGLHLKNKTIEVLYPVCDKMHSIQAAYSKTTSPDLDDYENLSYERCLVLADNIEEITKSLLWWQEHDKPDSQVCVLMPENIDWLDVFHTLKLSGINKENFKKISHFKNPDLNTVLREIRTRRKIFYFKNGLKSPPWYISNLNKTGPNSILITNNVGSNVWTQAKEFYSAEDSKEQKGLINKFPFNNLVTKRHYSSLEETSFLEQVMQYESFLKSLVDKNKETTEKNIRRNNEKR